VCKGGGGDVKDRCYEIRRAEAEAVLHDTAFYLPTLP